MKTSVDYAAQSVYVKIGEGQVSRTRALSDVINLDFNSDGELLGLEVLRMPTPADLEEVLKSVTPQQYWFLATSLGVYPYALKSLNSFRQETPAMQNSNVARLPHTVGV